MRFGKLLSVLLALGGSFPAWSAAPLTNYVSYLGGSNAENVAGIAVDSSGSEYVAGTTNSPDFPLTSTSLGIPSFLHSCSFVTKLNPAGTGIIFSICVGNSQAQAFGVDAGGNLYLAVAQTGGPLTSEAVLKLDPTGTGILYNTSIGVTSESMAVDATGDVYLTGSATGGLATTAGAFQQQPTPGSCTTGNSQQTCADAFVMKLNPAGKVVWATYLGGSGPDEAHAIAVDSTGSPWIAGETVSKDFPVTANALEPTFHGEVDLGPLRFGDAFIAKLDPTGGKLLYSTYLGGSAPDGALAIAIDAADSVYVTGGTQSPDFPTTAGALQSVYSGQTNQQPSLSGDAFVAKFNASGQIVYSTFLGGPSGIGAAIAVNKSGQVAVNAAEPTQSPTQVQSPTSAQSSTSACAGASAVTLLNATGSAVAGVSPVIGSYLATDGGGGLYSGGQSTTLIFLTTPKAFQTKYGGGASDAYAGKVDFSLPAGPALSSVLNAGTFLGGYASPFPNGSVAPGELVALFGNGFGTQPTVSFGNFPAPLIYVSNCQINAVVPFEVAGSTVAVGIQSGGQAVGQIELPVVPAAPGVFTLNASGTGQAAILNQDGSINSASNPAARGSVVSLYMTGTGALTPALADGAPGPVTPPYPVPVAGITATIGSVNASVLFEGQAPTLIAGVTQLNILIPQNAPTGAADPVTIDVAGYVSQLNQSVVMAVK